VDIGKPRRVITVEPEREPAPGPLHDEPVEEPTPTVPAERSRS
jgi:hypothetical protein